MLHHTSKYRNSWYTEMLQRRNRPISLILQNPILYWAVAPIFWSQHLGSTQALKYSLSSTHNVWFSISFALCRNFLTYVTSFRKVGSYWTLSSSGALKKMDHWKPEEFCNSNLKIQENKEFWQFNESSHRVLRYYQLYKPTS